MMEETREGGGWDFFRAQTKVCKMAGFDQQTWKVVLME